MIKLVSENDNLHTYLSLEPDEEFCHSLVNDFSCSEPLTKPVPKGHQHFNSAIS